MESLDLTQIGIGVAMMSLVMTFFIPYIRSLTKKMTEKDLEIARLNDVIKSQSEQKYTDFKETILPLIDTLKQFKATSDLILQELLKKNG